MSAPFATLLPTLQHIVESGFFAGCLIRLCGTPITVGTSTSLAQLLAAEATFAGYSPAVCSTPSPPSLTSGAAPAHSTVQAMWTPTGPGGTSPLYAFFVTDSTGAELLGADNINLAPVYTPQGEPYVQQVDFQLFLG